MKVERVKWVYLLYMLNEKKVLVLKFFRNDKYFW